MIKGIQFNFIPCNKRPVSSRNTQFHLNKDKFQFSFQGSQYDPASFMLFPQKDEVIPSKDLLKRWKMTSGIFRIKSDYYLYLLDYMNTPGRNVEVIKGKGFNSIIDNDTEQVIFTAKYSDGKITEEEFHFPEDKKAAKIVYDIRDNSATVLSIDDDEISTRYYNQNDFVTGKTVVLYLENKDE